MTVPTNPKLRQVAGLCDRIANFGSFPPTVAYRDAFNGEGILLNLQDPDATGAKGAAQVEGIRSHGVWAGVWHPVPPAGDSGSMRARLIDEKVDAIDNVLVAGGHAKLDVVWLNLEGYSVSQWRSFIWGDAPALPGQTVKGWRGANGAVGSTGGYRSGTATGVVDEPFKDGSVKPHADFKLARFELAVEGFYGPTSNWPDMTPADHPQAIVDRLQGFRSDGTFHDEDAYPRDQVVGCYDAALGKVVGPPAEPLLLRRGLHFTLERARQAQII